MDPKYFDEEDIKVLFPDAAKNNLEVEFEPEKIKEPESEPKIKSAKKPAWRLYAKFAGLFFGIFVITYFLINISAISKNFRYFWDVKLRHTAYQKALATPEPKPSFDATAQAKLVIPKIGAEAPIIWNIGEEEIQKKLLEGVVQYQGTALPGQMGNIFITGHSSYYSWSSSPYKDVFALLEKLSVGDQIFIQYNGANFIYEVTETKVVSPKNIEVMDQTSDYRLTLMTCVPIGTNLNRLIVTSKQVVSSE